MTSHTRPWKEAQLVELKKLASQYPVIAIADISMFPAALFQDLRKKLHGKAVVKVSKVRLMQMALESAGEKKALKPYTEKSCAIIFTEMNPFEVYAFLKKNKGSMYAKEGMLAEADITIPARDTGLPPGPALSDLKSIGLQIQVQGSTIHITRDKVVTKLGEVITGPVASTLQKLDIKPVKVGLKLVAAFENGQVYLGKVLDIDTDMVFANFMRAYSEALNLAVFVRYPTSASTPLLVQKAFREAKEVALAGNVFNEETMPEVLAEAYAQAKALKGKVHEPAAGVEPVAGAEAEPVKTEGAG